MLNAPLVFWALRLAFNDLIWQVPFPKDSSLRWNLMGVVLVVCAAGCAAGIPKIETVFGVFGGVGTPLINFMLPSVYYLGLCRGSCLWKDVCAWAFCVFSVVFIVIDLYGTFSDLAKK
jgi:amino acid permease